MNKKLLALARPADWKRILPKIEDAIEEIRTGKRANRRAMLLEITLARLKATIRDVEGGCCWRNEDLFEAESSTYDKAGPSEITKLIRDLDETFELTSARKLSGKNRIVARGILGGTLDGYVLTESRLPDSADGLLNRHKTAFRAELNLNDFYQEVEQSQNIFIFQNALPGANTIFHKVFARLLELGGQGRFRMTVYDPRSAAYRLRAEEVEQMSFGGSLEMAKLIDVTRDEFQKYQSELGLRLSPDLAQCAELRYLRSVMPYVVYATDAAVRVGWLWKSMVTNDGLQLYGENGSEFFKLIWQFLESAWENCCFPDMLPAA